MKSGEWTEEQCLTEFIKSLEPDFLSDRTQNEKDGKVNHIEQVQTY